MHGLFNELIGESNGMKEEKPYYSWITLRGASLTEKPQKTNYESYYSEVFDFAAYT